METKTMKEIRSLRIKAMRVPHAPDVVQETLRKAEHFAQNEMQSKGKVSHWNRDRARRLITKAASLLATYSPTIERKPRQVGKTAKSKTPSHQHKIEKAERDRKLREEMRGRR